MNCYDYDTHFTKLFSDFIYDMEKIPPNIEHPEVFRSVAKICKFLRISEFTASLMESPEVSDNNPQYHETTFFSEGESDNDLSITIIKDTPGGLAKFIASPYKNSDVWNDAEKEKIHMFLTTFFIFSSRARNFSVSNYLMYHDEALGIYNVKFLARKISELLAENKAVGNVCCRFNLRKFSLVNKILGRKTGTVVMKRFVLRLKEIAGDDSYLCRLGGDNFLMLLPENKIHDVINFLSGSDVETGKEGNEYIRVSARASFLHITEDCHTTSDIIDRTTLALNMLRETPGSLHFIYDEKARKKEENMRMVEENFLNAIRNEEFLVYYQPKAELHDYSLCGAEALCRWKHNGEIIPPGAFIPVLEQSSHICTLDMYMLEHVCRDIRRWLDIGLDVVRVSVNLSRVNLGNQKLAEQIISTIRKYDVPFKYIEIEVTETTSEVDLHELIKVVKKLHEVGICTSIDDFGVGYSSLNLIRDLPWDTMKIDKSFLPLAGEMYNDQKKTMLKYVIAMAQDLGLECMMEGVETTEHIAILKENDCYYAQGFCFDMPLPVNIFENRLRDKVLTLKQ
ncbi:MAG: EAL domain-containing protein [Ruminococcus sp.]|nr:EAL domain-containing protein [Ruminococcus sp.]